MNKSIILIASCAWLILGLISTANAASITYDSESRPIEFVDIDIDGTQYDVSVTWGGTFEDTYGSGGSYVAPTFLANPTGANNAASSMRDALIADGFSPISDPQYLLWVPSAFSGIYNGPGVNLRGTNLGIISVSVAPGTSYPNVGYTQFSLSAVPVPAAVWLFGSGLIGLIGIARRQKV